MKIILNSLSRFKGSIVEIELGEHLTTLVGPNGSGKSTLLESLAILLHFASKGEVHYPVTKIREELSCSNGVMSDWESASISIQISDEVRDSSFFADIFDKLPLGENIDIKISKHPTIEGSLFVEQITYASTTLNINRTDAVYGNPEQINALIEDRNRLRTLEGELQRKRQEHKNALEKARNQAKRIPQGKVQQILIDNVRNGQGELQQVKDKKKELNSRIARLSKSEVLFESGKRAKRSSFAKLLDSTFPKIHYTQGSSQIDTYIEDLTIELKEFRDAKGSYRTDSDLNILVNELETYLEAPIEVEGTGEEFKLTIGNRAINKLSSGTYICLGFFSLSRNVEENGVILWDEPENSVHPTRRHKMCSLMLEDQRKYIVASHQTEFVRIFTQGCNVYHLSRLFADDGEPSCQIESAYKLRHAFSIIQKLGLEPAKTLFTTNAIIWVEGPSDILYWRQWIRNYIEERNINLVEGFDFSFVSYSGSLLSHYTVWDGDPGTEIDALINVLRICSTCIIIADTDLDPSEVNPSVLEEYTQNSKSSLIRDYLKSRVQKILEAEKRVCETGGSNVLVRLTLGRETENYLSDVALRKTCAKLLMNHVDERYFEEISSDLWLHYAENIEQQLFSEFNEEDIFEYTDSGKRLKGRSILADKVRFAEAYVDLNLGIEDRAKEHVSRVVDFLQKNRAEYS